MWLKRLVFSTTFIALLQISSPGRADLIKYTLVGYPAEQDGWTVTGFIETDGTLGSLTSANITDWAWAIEKGSESYACDDETPNASAWVGDGIVATADTISLLPGDDAEVFSLDLGEFQELSITWANEGGYGPWYAAWADGGAPRWYSQSMDMWNDGRVIAMIPEPAVFVLFWLGMLSIVSARTGRGRQSY